MKPKSMPYAAVMAALAVAVLPAVLPTLGVLAAQTEAGSLASQTLGRGYAHLFWAYAIAWVLVLGWTISIARRLARLERRLEE